MHSFISMNSMSERYVDKTNTMTFAHSQDSDKPGHLHSLIRVFTVRMKKVSDIRYL